MQSICRADASLWGYQGAGEISQCLLISAVAEYKPINQRLLWVRFKQLQHNILISAICVGYLQLY